MRVLHHSCRFGFVLRGALAQDNHRVNPFTPFVVRQTDYRYVMNRRVAADHHLDLGRVNVLAASDDHVALAVDEMNEAVGVAARHVADRAIVAAERLACLFRQLPIAVENVGIAGVELADFAVRNFVAIRIEKLDRSRTYAFASDRAELVELLVRMKHCHPAGLGRTVEFEEAGVGEHLHDGALGVRSRGRRRDHQLGDPA